jgi:hypothetical protein
MIIFFMNLARAGGFHNQGAQNEIPLVADTALVRVKDSCIIFYDLGWEQKYRSKLFTSSAMKA